MIDFEGWKPNSKQRYPSITCEGGFEFGTALCFLAIVIGAFQEGETGMRCGEIPQCRSCPRNCKRSFAIQLSHWTCPASLGRRIARRPRARRPAADGYQLVRRWVDGRGSYGFPELCCRFGGNRCFGMLYWRRTRAIESRPTPSSGGQSRRTVKTSASNSPSHQPSQSTRAGTEQSWLSTRTALRTGRYTRPNA